MTLLHLICTNNIKQQKTNNMKKIFTLALTLFILSSAAFSQSTFAHVSINTPNVSLSFNKGFPDRNVYYSNYDRDMQIQRIKQAYNEQVNQVMNLRISAKRKVRLIHQLQNERDANVQNVNCGLANDYNNRLNYNRYYDHDDRNWGR
jgi:hypothetical protein